MSNPNHLSQHWLNTIRILAILYVLAVMFMCFTPQPSLFGQVETPNIIVIGRLRLLLVPFNSIFGWHQITSLYQLLRVFCQNILNVFLLFPFVFFVHLLTGKWHGYKKSALLGFLISLTIEVTQLVLDLAIDANRVFEIDDLWTNSLGAVFAYFMYRLITKNRVTKI
ncbi:VanZ family protein [Streptococcus iniae]|uniref:VanZ family protein n=1 Tax=Streptococcus iniae TaxID=1346 RepID=UPI0002830D94|nr:VanZ family protein [Streptococcus iniae]EKB51453.1 VanZ family protein [Streptococcus iniae 9117]RLV29384.1 VanZ family protein [Streptococcus iniae]RMI82142.1 VanZ family protein [Streptococcus iniae]